MDFGHIKKIHFVGIGGIGMSGIAAILASYDLEISGCDARRSATTERLDALGIRVTVGHDPVHVHGADLVVVSSAIGKDAPEVLEAREREIPVMRRAEMLGELMHLKKGIAIAGTHGKTTTSAMTSMVLDEAGFDPTLIIGGVIRNLEVSARLGKSDYLVVEADEYDRSFLTLHPTISVVTNIEADHLDCYRDLDDIRSTFAEFANLVPFFGLVVGCVDDANVASLLETLPKRTLRYGLSETARLRGVELKFEESGTSFDVVEGGERLGRVRLRVPGEHNVLNALAAVGVARELDIPFGVIAAGLAKFTGVERRFQLLGEYHGALVVDDYAHHPTEIRATLDAARRSYPARRIVALFQPHLYSRTRDFFENFAESLSTADVALVSPIYPAREEPIEGVTASLITLAAEKHGNTNVRLIDRDTDGIVGELQSMLGPQDLFLTLGAGDVHRVGEALVGGGR